MKKILLSASLLAADFSELREEMKKLDTYHISYLHLDVMDGHYVPNLSFGASVIKDIMKLTKVPLDVHLMVENPSQYLDDFMALKPAIITVHQEAAHFNEKLFEKIKAKGIKAGVSLNPKTPISVLKNLLPQVDVVLMMTVTPGFYGQSYIPEMTDKIKELKKIKDEQKLDFLIETDGGIDEKTIGLVQNMIDMTVLGKAFFKNPDLDRFMSSLGYKD